MVLTPEDLENMVHKTDEFKMRQYEAYIDDRLEEYLTKGRAYVFDGEIGNMHESDLFQKVIEKYEAVGWNVKWELKNPRDLEAYFIFTKAEGDTNGNQSR